MQTTENIVSLDLIRRIVAFDTTSHEPNLALIDFMKDYLADLGVVSSLLYDTKRRKANLFATLGPDDQPGILLSGHTDIVPVYGQRWSTDPFDLAERDGKLFGRGTADMKSFIAVALALAPEFLRRGLKTPIHFAFSYDEEVGCLGVHHLIDKISAMPVKPAMCIVGEPTNMQVVTGHKGMSACRARVTGFSTHSSLAPRGVNAIEFAAELIVCLRDIGRRLAGEGPFDSEYDVPFGTIHTGVIQGGTALNIIPSNCSFDFEFRYLPEQDPKTLLSEIEAYARKKLEPQMHAVSKDTGIEIEEIYAYPGLDTKTDEKVVAFVKALTGCNEHRKVNYGAEAGLFQHRAVIPTVVCGPGSIEQAHKPDEFITIEQVAKCETFMRRLMDQVCTR